MKTLLAGLLAVVALAWGWDVSNAVAPAGAEASHCCPRCLRLSP